MRRSSYVQLEGLELAANGIATRASGCSASSMFANKDVDTLLAQAANAFGTRIAVSKDGQLPTCSTIYLDGKGEGRR